MSGVSGPISVAETRALARMLPGDQVPMAADGSGRRFFRDRRGRIAILPDPHNPLGMREARACWHIGNHLHNCAVPVPRMFDFDPETGIVVAEDLGDLHLHDLVRAEGEDSPLVHSLYRRVVGELARMQVTAANGLDPSWCWQGSVYDRELMLNLESRYFLREFVYGEMGVTRVDPAVEAEFALLADRAASLPATFFLHRDFQSRNIMVADGEVYFIDFQGGRRGPLPYDLASLLVDPYVALGHGLREELFSHYLTTLAGMTEIDLPFFLKGYYCLSLQRNLQILGAFARLANRERKEEFRVYLVPALRSLARQLEEVENIFPALTALVVKMAAEQARIKDDY